MQIDDNAYTVMLKMCNVKNVYQLMGAGNQKKKEDARVMINTETFIFIM